MQVSSSHAQSNKKRENVWIIWMLFSHIGEQVLEKQMLYFATVSEKHKDNREH